MDYYYSSISDVFYEIMAIKFGDAACYVRFTKIGVGGGKKYMSMRFQHTWIFEKATLPLNTSQYLMTGQICIHYAYN